jgi:hypothetical protein
MAEEHRHAVAGIVLCCEHVGLADAVPVETGVEQSLWEVAVRIEVRPLALALETCCDGVVTE